MNSSLLQQAWNEAALWQMIAAPLAGAVVGAVYFYSMRWSINHLDSFKHKLAMYSLAALARIVLFFGVMILIGGRNIAVILLYLVVFFLARMVILGLEKNSFGGSGNSGAGKDGI